ncbi:MAG: hypothetical protein KBC41_02725 [Candidatus Pacebacteria bacterium]|nr:hypothetical protein [Candidatus Paceibacterota bacterium]
MKKTKNFLFFILKISPLIVFFFFYNFLFGYNENNEDLNFFSVAEADVYGGGTSQGDVGGGGDGSVGGGGTDGGGNAAAQGNDNGGGGPAGS